MKSFDETTSSHKTTLQAVGHLTARFLATGGFKFKLFQNACMVYMHAVFAAFQIYAQRGEDIANRRGWRLCIK